MFSDRKRRAVLLSISVACVLCAVIVVPSLMLGKEKVLLSAPGVEIWGTRRAWHNERGLNGAYLTKMCVEYEGRLRGSVTLGFEWHKAALDEPRRCKFVLRRADGSVAMQGECPVVKTQLGGSITSGPFPDVEACYYATCYNTRGGVVTEVSDGTGTLTFIDENDIARATVDLLSGVKTHEIRRDSAGALAAEFEMENGLFHGTSVWYHRNGRVRRVAEYKHGVATGVQREYDEYGAEQTDTQPD